MPTNNGYTNQQTTTQIRTLFCDTSYLNLKFYNNRLALTICRKIGIDQNGKPMWDNGPTTTVTYEKAVQLIEACKLATQDPWKPREVTAQETHNEVATNLSVIDSKGPKGFVATLTISKNNEVYSFTFESMNVKVKNDTTGQMTDLQIQTQLITFKRILESYVDGINSDRHLDKLTDDYVKANGDNQRPQQGQQQYQNQRNNWGRNNNNGGNRRWNNNRNNYGGGNNNGGYRN